jgi:cellulose synthase/poly-beta-1,6-N-acetylglucosamine synthase-like glycosyltransferase
MPTYEMAELPTISILLAVFNEEKVIEEKLKSTFNTNYPIDKIEFFIGSDASNDKTDEIIKKYQQTFSQIKLVRFEGRTGKPAIINKLKEKANGEILVLTDANVFFEPNTLKNLIKYFSNPKIGLVGGNILNLETKKDGISSQEKKYLNIENQTKYYEGLLWGRMMGAFGGLFALRRDLYEPVPQRFIVDDFYISMKVIEKKYDCINALDALAYEDVSNIPAAEFKRKVRIGIGNYQNLVVFKSLIFSDLKTSFCFLSHKVLRWKGPFFILFSLISALVLAANELIYLWFALALLLFVLTPLLDFVLKKVNIHIKLLRFASHFVSMNLALLVGFLKFVSGNYQSTWTPTQRNQ